MRVCTGVGWGRLPTPLPPTNNINNNKSITVFMFCFRKKTRSRPGARLSQVCHQVHPVVAAGQLALGIQFVVRPSFLRFGHPGPFRFARAGAGAGACTSGGGICVCIGSCSGFAWCCCVVCWCLGAQEASWGEISVSLDWVASRTVTNLRRRVSSGCPLSPIKTWCLPLTKTRQTCHESSAPRKTSWACPLVQSLPLPCPTPPATPRVSSQTTMG